MGSIKRYKSKAGALVAGGYLLLTLAVTSPLIWDGYIGHGNGVVFLLAAALTSPLSLILLLLNDLVSDVNTFYMTGWPYFLTLAELGAGALLNAGLIYWVITFIQRKWRKARRGNPALEAENIKQPNGNGMQRTHRSMLLSLNFWARL